MWVQMMQSHTLSLSIIASPEKVVGHVYKLTKESHYYDHTCTCTHLSLNSCPSAASRPRHKMLVVSSRY